MHELSFGFHTRADPSAEAVKTDLPSWENIPQVTESLCPLRTAMHAPLVAFHIHTDASELPASRTSPLECQLMKVMSSPGPSKDATGEPSFEFHTLTIPSIPAVATSDPDTLNATCTTVSVCPSSVAMRCFVALSHSPPVSSPLPVAIKLAFDGCSATQYISPVCPSIRPFETSTTGSSSSTLCAPASSSSSSSSISSSPSSSSWPSSSHATRPWSAGSEGSMKTSSSLSLSS
mmetsp:Transcript_13902/g.22104  ORF Transcript_13902/g.22104 Transcript_13902/m.22104 type:complete len:233 (-) Transcript_13902:63-761(-)